MPVFAPGTRSGCLPCGGPSRAGTLLYSNQSILKADYFLSAKVQIIFDLQRIGSQKVIDTMPCIHRKGLGRHGFAFKPALLRILAACIGGK